MGKIDGETAAAMAVCVYGTPCDHAGLESVCAPASVPIIYDAAHSFASKINGRPGADALGRASATSFHAIRGLNSHNPE